MRKMLHCVKIHKKYINAFMESSMLKKNFKIYKKYFGFKKLCNFVGDENLNVYK